MEVAGPGRGGDGLAVSLRPRPRRLEFQFAGLSFVAPEKVRYRYQLEGYDPDWVEAGTGRTAHYTGLPPRDYRFRVIACNSDGVWNEVGAAWDFRLDPALHETGLVPGGLRAGPDGWRRWGCTAGASRNLRRSEQRLQTRIAEAVARIKILSGLLPICAACKKIRDDQGYWEQIEVYIRDHSEAQFSHGLCPACIRAACTPSTPTRCWPATPSRTELRGRSGRDQDLEGPRPGGVGERRHRVGQRITRVHHVGHAHAALGQRGQGRGEGPAAGARSASARRPPPSEKSRLVRPWYVLFSTMVPRGRTARRAISSPSGLPVHSTTTSARRPAARPPLRRGCPARPASPAWPRCVR